VSAVLLGGLLAAVAVSSLLVAAAVAVFGVGDSRLRTLSEEGFPGAEALRALRSRGTALRTALRLVVSLLNLTVVGLAAAWGWTTGDRMTGTVVLILSVAVVLTATEIVPRAVAARWPIRIALWVAPPLLAVERWLRWVLFPVDRLERALAGDQGDGSSTTEARQVREITELGREEGIVNAEEHLLVERAFRLDELTAWDIMVPRVDIFAWPDSLQLRDIIDEIRTVPYSRVPVYGESIDDVKGILYIREAYAAYTAGRQDVSLSGLARDPLFVPGSLSLAQLLRAFQARRIHMGIVADEFGGTDGLVTLEDVLEELVGEIVDEKDVAEEPIMRMSRSELVADGGVDLREINYAFNVSLPQLEHRSLNGFILEELGYVPERGECIERDGVQIEILEATETQVVRARLRKLGAGTLTDERSA
jgi:CBS domain containing-hemolysin-like protein